MLGNYATCDACPSFIEPRASPFGPVLAPRHSDTWHVLGGWASDTVVRLRSKVGPGFLTAQVY